MPAVLIVSVSLRAQILTSASVIRATMKGTVQTLWAFSCARVRWALKASPAIRVSEIRGQKLAESHVTA